jgi:hypothetical protein
VRLNILVTALFDCIGIGYGIRRQADPYLLSWRALLLYHSRPSSMLDLDVGCETGNYRIAMRKAGFGDLRSICLRRCLWQAAGKSRSLRPVAGAWRES